LVVFDVTGVMDNSATFMQRAMGAVFANVREQDKVAAGVIGPAFEMLMGFRTIDKNKPPTVRLPATRFGSNLYESLDTAARRFGKEDTRKAIFALTDGRETRMFTETQKLLAPKDIEKDTEFQGHVTNAQKRGVPYYFIAIDTDPRYLGPTDMEYLTLKNRTATPKGKDSTLAEDYLAAVKLRMERLSEVTGGRVTYVKSLPEIVDAFDRITRELGYSYTMGYYPKVSLDDGKVHKIEIRTRSYKVEQSRTTYGGLK
jgi:hypothetical protein